MKNQPLFMFQLLVLLLTATTGAWGEQATGETLASADAIPASPAEIRRALAEIDPLFEQPWYQVEVLVFENPESLMDEEFWPPLAPEETIPYNSIALDSPSTAEDQAPSTGTPDDSSFSVNLLDPAAAYGAFTPLPGTQWLLTDIRQRLEKRHYQTLFHQSWIQPLSDRGNGEPVYIESASTPTGEPSLKGYLQASIARYLHINLALWFTRWQQEIQIPESQKSQLAQFGIQPDSSSPDLEHQPWQGTDSGKSLSSWNNTQWQQGFQNLSDLQGATLVYTPAEIIRLSEKRRMRSDELHYLDNPVIGALVQISPYEHPLAAKRQALEEALEESRQ